jgi:hypothetical protein
MVLRRLVRRTFALVILSFALGAALTACPSPDVMPLIGEDPEVGRLLGKQSADDPSRSPLSAARRLHQALVQQDTTTVWALLSSGTRQALDERGAAISASGRELIDESALPGEGGTVRKVRFETIFFGPRLLELKELPCDNAAAPSTRCPIVAVSEDGAETRLEFVHEEEAWKLEHTGL